MRLSQRLSLAPRVIPIIALLACAGPLATLRLGAVWGLVAGGMVAFLAALFVARGVRRRVAEMSEVIDQVSQGDLARRIPVQGNDEFARLARSFNSMVADLHTTNVALTRQSQRLQDALAEVESVESMKDSFLALVSHEVRTPLTSIMGGIEFLCDDSFERTDVETEFMKIVYESGQRLAGFMNDAILMASLQSSHSRSNFEEFSFSKLVGTKLQEQAEFAEKCGVFLQNNLEVERELFADGDWTLLQVALEKIFDNAVRHNGAGGRVELEVVDHVREDAVPVSEFMEAASTSGGWWKALRIFNTGPIIPESKLTGLFQRFELTYEIENHQRGSGLSLPIAMYVLEFHGGTIVVRPVGDEGMAFYLILPMRTGVKVSATPDVEVGVDETVHAARILAP